MAVTTTQIREKIVEIIERVPNVGAVHSYERYASSKGALKAFYVVNGQLRGWFLRRVRVQRASPVTGSWHVTTRWNIRGYVALADGKETAKVVDELVDQISAQFQADEELGGLVDSTTVGNEAGIQLEDSGPYMFADVLCHGVKLALVTRHYE